MTQAELDIAVARTTGEALSTVEAQGFGLFLGGCWSEDELLWFLEQVEPEEVLPAVWTEAEVL